MRAFALLVAVALTACAKDEWARLGDPASARLDRNAYGAPRAGSGRRPTVRIGGASADEADPAARAGGPFRNTYYDFPTDPGGDGVTVFDGACRPVAAVSRGFFEALCVQGSGRLSTGDTVSYARRDCACAQACARTGQHLCFERLDPQRFPWGRGALGRAITPLYSIAVDASVIPLGARVFIPEAAGLPRPDGSLHDGCFAAEDRGSAVVGQHVDLFTGDPSVTAVWNRLLPSNAGVHVVVGDPRCARQ